VARIGKKTKRQTSSEDVTQNVYECDFSTENKITSAPHLRSKSSELLQYYSEEANFENQNIGESLQEVNHYQEKGVDLHTRNTKMFDQLGQYRQQGVPYLLF
jgi:hypothetical protein